MHGYRIIQEIMDEYIKNAWINMSRPVSLINSNAGIYSELKNGKVLSE